MSNTKDSSKPAEPIWHKLTKEGNSKMKEKLPEEAEVSYSKAMTIAENLWQQTERLKQYPETIHLYIIACHNLADCYEAMGLTKRAESYLLQAHDRTLTTIANTSFTAELRMEGYRGLQMVLRQLVDFYRRAKNLEAISRIALKSQQQAQQFLKESIEQQPN
jgi:tetratricopeptide (TPR) repeat protein